MARVRLSAGDGWTKDQDRGQAERQTGAATRRFGLSALTALACSAAGAEDRAGRRDHPMVSRGAGAVIVDGRRSDFDAARFPGRAKTGKAADDLAAAMRSGLDQAGRIALYSLYFDTGRADVKPESEAQLAEIAAVLTADPHGDVCVAGHTDMEGALAANQDLARRRAQAVAASLTRDHGVDAARLSAAGVGPRAPVASNAIDAGRALDRRVEIVARGTTPPSARPGRVARTARRGRRQRRRGPGGRRVRVIGGGLAPALFSSPRAAVRDQRRERSRPTYSTVTDFARLRGWSTSVPLATAAW